MKRAVKIVSLMLVVATLAVLAVSCGSSIVGTWEGEVLGQKFSYEFKKDGTYTGTVTVLGVSSSTEGKYEYKDGKLSLDGGAAAECKVDGNTLEFVNSSSISLKLTKK